MIDMVKTGEILKTVRERNNLTRKDIAAKLGITYMAVYKWEHGRALPSIDNLYTLSNIYNTTMEDLMEV